MYLISTLQLIVIIWFFDRRILCKPLIT